MSEGAFVRSLSRGLDVLLALGRGRPELTLAEVARSTGLSPATARRSLLTLAELGFVHAECNLFSLRPRVLDLGRGFLTTTGLSAAVQARLQRLATETSESVALVVLDGTDVVVVAHAETPRLLAPTRATGTRWPAHVSAGGRALLAGLSETAREKHLGTTPLSAHTEHSLTDADALREVLRTVRTEGYSVVDQELEVGLLTVGAPVPGTTPVPVALAVSLSAARWSTRRVLDEIVQVTVAAARDLGGDLRVASPP